MFEGVKKLRVLSAAGTALQARAKVQKALRAELDKLGELVVERLESERALVASEVSAVLGEPSDAARARGRVDEVLVAIDRKASVIAGLRMRLAVQATELEGSIRGIAEALPAHVELLKSDFLSEWTRGCAIFAALLGRRQALEALVGKLELPEPEPANSDLGDAALPWRVTADLRSALEEVASWSRGAAWPAGDALGGRLKPYDPREVYVLTRPFDELLPVGALVVEASLPPGFLNHLVQIEYAVAVGEQSWLEGVEAGRLAAARLAYEAQQQEARVQETVAPSYTPAELAEFRRGAESNKNLVAETIYPANGGRVTI